MGNFQFYSAKPGVLHLSLQFYFEQVLRIPAAALLISDGPPLRPVGFFTVGLEEVIQTTSMSSGYVCLLPSTLW